MAKHLKSHQSSFNRQTVIFIAKGNSSSYNNLSVLLGKKSPFFFYASYFYTKGQNGWVAQSDLWASQPFAFPMLHFSKLLQKYYINKSWPVLYEEGPAWFSRNFFHAAASAARPSNKIGSKTGCLAQNSRPTFWWRPPWLCLITPSLLRAAH